MRIISLTGMRFGRLIVKRRDALAKKGLAMWICRCDCGNVRSIASYSLRKGITRSCGCLRREISKKATVTHGMSKTSTYRVWLRMRRRCYDRNWDKWKWYGGRGITVCKRWEKFENFYEDMGERPKGMSLDRKDNSKNYSPANCRWASWQTQQNNRRNNRLITFQGRTQTMAQWCREVGISSGTLSLRLGKLGWSVNRALTEPIHRE